MAVTGGSMSKKKNLIYGIVLGVLAIAAILAYTVL